MKKNTSRIALFSLGMMTLFGLASCDNNDTFESSVEKTITFENVVNPKDFVESGSFQGTNTPVIMPGESVSFTFSAGKAQSLMFATMYGASKDWFFASQQPGIKLFNDNGTAITGDVSSQVLLWDNGSKDNTTGNAESKPIAQVPNVAASNLQCQM